MAPTVGYANNATAMYKLEIGPSLVGTDELKKSSNSADAKRTTQSAHTDQAIHAAVRWLIPPIPRLCCLARSVTTPHYSTTVSQALRSALRAGVPRKYPPAPATHEGMVVPRIWRGDTSYLTSFSNNGEYTPITFSEATQSLSNGLRGDSNGKYSRNLTGGSHAPSLTCFQTLASTIPYR
jgi:hypothetical protein